VSYNYWCPGSRTHAPQQEKLPQQNTHTPQLESSLCSLQLEKAHSQQKTQHSQKKKIITFGYNSTKNLLIKILCCSSQKSKWSICKCHSHNKRSKKPLVALATHTHTHTQRHRDTQTHRQHTYTLWIQEKLWEHLQEQWVWQGLFAETFPLGPAFWLICTACSKFIPVFSRHGLPMSTTNCSRWEEDTADISIQKSWV